MNSATFTAGTCFSVGLLSMLNSRIYWIVDSGASKHICTNRSLFLNLKPLQNSTVTLPNNAVVPVKHIGDVRLKQDLLLTDVLYVPDFKFNLLSISALTTDLPVVSLFHNTGFVLLDTRNSKMIGKGSRINDLYILEVEQDSVAGSINKVSAQVWHDRLGHVSLKRLQSLQNQLDFQPCNKDKPCYICPLAKQRRLSFPSNNHLASSPFDVIHCDIWGAYHVESHAGFRYFLTLVDDCTRYCWIYMMKHKSDVHCLIPRFYNMVETQFGSKVKQFRSDNARELVFADFFSKTGTLHQFSCVQCPEQNSVLERKHQHLLNVARALYFQSRVPIKFWAECVLTAAFLINRVPSPVVKHKTPYELIHNKLVDYSSLRVFGCLVFASTLSAGRTKFQPRARTCVFLGYPQGIKGYRLYDIVNKEVFVSQDVVFHETIFPFHSICSQEALVDPFVDLVLPKAHNAEIPASSLLGQSNGAPMQILLLVFQ